MSPQTNLGLKRTDTTSSKVYNYGCMNCPDCNEPMEVKKLNSPKKVAEDFGKIVFKELWKLNKDYYNNLSKEKLAEELFKSGIEHAFLTAEKLHEDLKKQRKIYSLYAMDYNQLNFEDGNSSPCFKAEVSLP